MIAKRNACPELECAITSITERFVPCKDLLEDCTWLDPRNYGEMLKLDNFPENVFKTISQLAKFSRGELILELKQFSG